MAIMMTSPPTQAHFPANDVDSEHALQPLFQQLYEGLRADHGPILGGVDLARAMGYRSLAAFRQARRRGQIEVKLFTLPKRRGVFALGVDVAKWLAQAREANPVIPNNEEGFARHSD